MSDLTLAAGVRYAFRAYLDASPPVIPTREEATAPIRQALQSLGWAFVQSEQQPRAGGDTTLSLTVIFQPTIQISIADLDDVILAAARTSQRNEPVDRLYQRHVPATSYAAGLLAVPLAPLVIPALLAGLFTSQSQSASQRVSEAWRRTAGLVVARSTIRRTTESDSPDVPQASSSVVGRALTTVTGGPRESQIQARDGASPARELGETIAAYVPGNAPVFTALAVALAVIVGGVAIGYTVRSFK